MYPWKGLTVLPEDQIPASHLRAAIARGEQRLKRRPGDPQIRREVDGLRAQYATAKLADFIAKVVNAAPPLTAEQRNRLAVLLRPNEAA